MSVQTFQAARITSPAYPAPVPSGDSVPSFSHARWLVRLRWIAVCGQLATLAALRIIGAASLRLVPLLAVESVIIVSNLLLWIVRRHPRLRGPRLIGPMLLFDTLMLTALLAFSGGPMNPYTVFFLVHVVMAAVLLGGRFTWTLIACCAVCYGSLFVLTPISPHHMHDEEFASHLYGMLSSFLIASVCVGYFVLLIQRERARAENRAAAACQAAARAESFASLTAIAAGAAHELATPLGTIAVASRELERAAAAIPGAAALAEDARLIREEVDRCRTILDALSPACPGSEDIAQVSPDELLTTLLDRLSAAARSRITIASVSGRPLALPRQRTAQAATALLQNALDAAPGTVSVRCVTDSRELTFRVEDQGPGMPPEVLARLGEPFFTSKRHGRGLGLFLVRQFVEQVGGRLLIESAQGAGTRVTMILLAPEAAT